MLQGTFSLNFFHPMFFHKTPPHRGLCFGLHLFVAGLLLFASVLALMGVYQAHVQPDGLYFGTANTSLSIIAFSVSIYLWIMQMKSCGADCDVCKVITRKK